MDLRDASQKVYCVGELVLLLLLLVVVVVVLPSPKSGGRSVGIVRLRTKSHGALVLVLLLLYGPLLGLGPFFSFLILYTVGLLGGGSARCKAATYTQNNTNRINAYRHPWLEWDSNPRSQCSSERRQIMS
jgi:hypothetical protein